MGYPAKHTLDDWHDSTLLDSRGALETISVDTAKKLGAEVHGIERIGDLVIVRLDLSCSTRNPIMLAMLVNGFDFCSSAAMIRLRCCAQRGGKPHNRRMRQLGEKPSIWVLNLPSGTSSRPLSAMIAI